MSRKPEINKKTKENKEKKTKMIIMAIVLSILIVASIATAAFVFFGKESNNNQKNNTSDSDDENLSNSDDSSEPNESEDTDSNDDNSTTIDLSTPFEVIPPDADDYFSDVGSVVSKTDAFNSMNVRTEKEVYDDFYQRGFTGIITTEYMMNGDLEEKKVISRTSSLRHPVYQTYYINSNEDVWLIVEINGAIMAMPVSYNVSLENQSPIMLSETDTTTSYDSTTNQFYVVKPNSDEMNLVTVESITTETLENYQLGGN